MDGREREGIGVVMRKKEGCRGKRRGRRSGWEVEEGIGRRKRRGGMRGERGERKRNGEKNGG